MSKRFMKLIAGPIALLISVSLTLGFAADSDKSQGAMKTNTNDKYTWFTINNLFNWYGNNGNSSYNTVTSNSGLEFPKGASQWAIYEDGVVWGGFHKGRQDPKVGGDVYRYGLQAGAVTGVGGPGEDQRPPFDDPTLEKYRPYKVRPDVTPTTPFAAVQSAMQAEADLISRYNTISAQALFDQYVQDWNEWPAKDGLPAPYEDVNKNGVYEPAIDVPGQPGADQTIYYVANDLNASRTQNLSGSPPIGLEVHKTVWGYNLTGALGNTVFASTLIINKSGAPLDSAFFVQWSDPDLGDSGDDYAGCDVDRSLGYIYNGKPVDDTYGTAVPAAGYDFFQGPIVPSPGDSAVFQLKYRQGYKNLGMSTFVFFINGSATYTDPAQGAGGDIQWYRLMNGRIAPSDAPFINPQTNQPTKFTLDGDPVAGKGWLDGSGGLVPGDRRICLVTGPFTLADGDTQELVVATLVGLGGDRISSVAVLKWYSDLAQSAYNVLFNIPRPPPSPKMTISELEGEIAISWADSVGSTKIETWNSAGYAFQGYNVYQFPNSSPDLTAGKLLATFDIVDAVTTIFDDVYDAASGYVLSKPVQFGTDSGIKRRYTTSTDAFTTTPLRNGSPYFYGVTSYSFNSAPTAVPAQLESSPEVATVTPQWPDPGTRLAAALGDTLMDNVHSGPSDGSVTAIVLNPTAMQKAGATYKVFFQGNVPNQTYGIVRTVGTRVDTVARGFTEQTGDEAGAPVVDGIQFIVIGASLDFKQFETVANANGPITPSQQGTFAFNANGFPLLDGSDRPDGTIQQAGLTSASAGWGIATGMNSATMSSGYDYFKSRVTQGDARWPLIIPNDFEIRFTAAGGRGWNAFTDETPCTVPFEIWNIGVATPNDPSDDYRLFPYTLDVDGNGEWNILTQAGVDTMDNGAGVGVADHTVSGGDNDPFTDWFYWVIPADASPGQAGYNAIVAQIDANTHTYLDPVTTAGTDVMRRMVLVGWNFGSVAAAGAPGTYLQQVPEVGTVFRITSTKPNGPSDAFTITAPPAEQNSELAQADADLVNVFPNPYIGFNPQELNKYARFVTFTHLPRKATVRVFNLAGVLCRTLLKDDTSQFFQWDLRNEDGFPVAAGMYLVYIDMPEVGKTKTLKLGIIPEQQFIDRW